jgi:hypothetical protein
LVASACVFEGFLAGVTRRSSSPPPAAMLFKAIVPKIPRPRSGAIVLAMSRAFPGISTILGSMAELIVIEADWPRGIDVSFWDQRGVPRGVG